MISYLQASGSLPMDDFLCTFAVNLLLRPVTKKELGQLSSHQALTKIEFGSSKKGIQQATALREFEDVNKGCTLYFWWCTSVQRNGLKIHRPQTELRYLPIRYLKHYLLR